MDGTSLDISYVVRRVFGTKWSAESICLYFYIQVG